MSTADKIAMAKRAFLNQRGQEWEFVLDGLGSPIESLFVATMLVVGFEPAPSVHARDVSKILRELEPPRSRERYDLRGRHFLYLDVLGISAVTQVPIGAHRVDLLLVRNDDERVVVELDGHDFHEKTKAQVARDKRRDRDLVVRGLRVIRFTGSEVYTRPLTCVREAIVAVYKNAALRRDVILCSGWQDATRPVLDVKEDWE